MKNILKLSHNFKIVTALSLVFLLIQGSFLTGISQEKRPQNPSIESERSFYMGFTPWPFSWRDEDLEKTYKLIQKHGDIISQHIDDGIPWPEAYAGKPYHPNVEEKLKIRLEHTNHQAHKVFLSVTPIDSMRKKMAGYWGKGGDEERPKPWKNKSFDDPQILQAYLNYCRRMIRDFQPDYFAYGIEVSILAEHNPEAFQKFIPFAGKVYTTLKAENPDLPIFLTFYIEHPEKLSQFKKTVEPLLPYTDIYAVSSYPYGFLYNGKKLPKIQELPKNWFRQVRDIAPDKPFAIAETGYLAEDFNAFGQSVKATEADQAFYAQFMLKEAQALDAEFVIWFTVADYDQLWSVLKWLVMFNPFARAWKDTGLLDGELKPRPALTIWDNWLERSVF